MMGDLQLRQFLLPVSLYQDALQMHLLPSQYFLHLQMHPMNSTLTDHGQNLKHMAWHLITPQNRIFSLVLLYYI